MSMLTPYIQGMLRYAHVQQKHLFHNISSSVTLVFSVLVDSGRRCAETFHFQTGKLIFKFIIFHLHLVGRILK